MNILIIKLSSYGDIFHALPAVHAVKEKFAANIDWVTQPEYVDLVRCFPDVDEVMAFPRRDFFAGCLAFRRALQKKKYDLVLDLHGIFKSALVAGMADGDRKIGPSCWRELALVFYGEIAGDRNMKRHAVDQLLDTAKYMGADISAPAFPVKFPEYGSGVGRPGIVMAPCSRWETKNWPLDNFAAVGKALVETKNAAISVIGGAADAAIGERLAGLIGRNAVNLCGKLSLPQTGGLIKESKLLISNDSGPVHMAVAVQTPVVVLFGPTDPLKIGPYSGKNAILTVPVECRPCGSRRCSTGDYKCLRDISPAMVIDAALKRL